MSGIADQVSVDALLSFIAQFTVEHFKDTGRRTDGAVLAEEIRHKFPGLTYKQLQLDRLSDAVRLAEQRGLVLRHRDVKHLELSPGPSSGLPPGTQVPAQATTLIPHVKPEIWRAFVFVSTGSDLFFDRETGHVVSVPDSDVSGRTSFAADRRYVRIARIPPSTQQGWMEEFTKRASCVNASDAPIHDDQWWVAFPAWLRCVNPTLERDWNRFRTGKVLEHLRQWTSENDVALGWLLSPPEAIPRSVPQRRIGTRGEGQISESEARRAAILAAVREMPLEQLEEIAIPMRYILRHFMPR